MSEKQRYHHGDLRNALLRAGLVILEEEGLGALSLRAIAARAGVSHAAPAHHFRSLKGLLTALVRIAFERFEAAMASERVKSDPSPIEQMRAAGRGYLAFARQHPSLFRLMFSGAQLDWNDEALKHAAQIAYQQLANVSRPAAEALGATSEVERAEIENLVWSTMHGYAHLLVDGHMSRPGCADSDVPPDIARFIFCIGLRRGGKEK